MNQEKEQGRVVTIPDFIVTLKFLENREMTNTDLHYETQITYSYLIIIKNHFLKRGWITSRRDGVRIYLRLTDKGKEIVEVINQLFSLIGIDKEHISEFRNKTKVLLKERKDDSKIKEHQGVVQDPSSEPVLIPTPEPEVDETNIDGITKELEDSNEVVEETEIIEEVIEENENDNERI